MNLLTHLILIWVHEKVNGGQLLYKSTLVVCGSAAGVCVCAQFFTVQCVYTGRRFVLGWLI